jgi:ketosteroid isomerase-like protein
MRRPQRSHTRRARPFMLAIVLSALAACAPAPPPDTRAQDEAALREADAAFSRAAQAKNVDTWLAFYADDVVVMAPNEAMQTGRDNARKPISDMLGTPGFGVSWKVTKADVARSGDLGYTVGTYELTMTGPDGKPMSDHGKYAEVWRKQTDGAWKVVVDTFNTDVPLPPPPPPTKAKK